MKSFGAEVKKLRESKGLPLRVVSAFLDMDQAILSKIERGQRKASREHVLKLASYFNVDVNELLVLWLSDRLLYELKDEELAVDALQLAESRVQYIKTTKEAGKKLISSIQSFFNKDGRVSNAWIFGSVARGEDSSESDLDILVELQSGKKYSMFDLIDMAHLLENKIKRKVDLFEKGTLKDFAQKTADKDLIKIYG